MLIAGFEGFAADFGDGVAGSGWWKLADFSLQRGGRGKKEYRRREREGKLTYSV